jgi:hypothetical protein
VHGFSGAYGDNLMAPTPLEKSKTNIARKGSSQVRISSESSQAASPRPTSSYRIAQGCKTRSTRAAGTPMSPRAKMIQSASKQIDSVLKMINGEPNSPSLALADRLTGAPSSERYSGSSESASPFKSQTPLKRSPPAKHCIGMERPSSSTPMRHLCESPIAQAPQLSTLRASGARTPKYNKMLNDASDLVGEIEKLLE